MGDDPEIRWLRLQQEPLDSLRLGRLPNRLPQGTYPVEFTGGPSLRRYPWTQFQTQDSLVEHIEDCTRMGIEVVPPSVNTSESEFSVANGRVYFGLSAIKGCGGSAAESIVRERKNGGPFKDILNFVNASTQPNVPKQHRNVGQRGSLRLHGAKRSAKVARSRKRCSQEPPKLKDKRIGQGSLFDAFGEEEEAASPATSMLPIFPNTARKKWPGTRRKCWAIISPLIH